MARFYQPKKKTSLNTKHTELTIEKLDHQGCGIAYQNKLPIFVEGVLPGEKALVQFTEQKSKFARAKKIKILQASSKRQEPFCPHYEQCGGCDLQHLSHADQVEHKQTTLAQLMGKFAAVEVTLEPTISPCDKGYRRRARVSLWWDKKSQQLAFGFRQKQSKQIVDVTDCAVLEPQLNQLLKPLKQWLMSLSKPEALGHVELVLADQGPVVVLRHTKPLTEQEHSSLQAFAAQYQVTFYLMPESHQLQRVVGTEPTYSELGYPIAFEPTHFIQVNRTVNQQMVEQAMDWLAPEADDCVLDLFCGVGNFTIPLAKQVKSVVGIEGVDEMVEQARYNARQNNLTNVEFFQANLDEALAQTSWGKQKFAKVLLDPARAGAHTIVAQLANFGAQRIVYVSCNPATLARDSQVLLEQGYQLEKIGMLDMFPYTGHLESMALFIRKKK